MTALVTIRLSCDGEPAPGTKCPTVFVPPEDVRNIRQARAVAYKKHKWATRDRDLCPSCRSRVVGA